MDYTEPLFEAEGAPYEDFDLDTGFEGSFIPGGSLEFTMRELANAIAASGQSPSGGNLEQLRRAAQLLAPADVASYLGAAPLLTFPALQLASGVVPVPRLPEGLQPRTYVVNGAMNVWQRGPAATFAVGPEVATDHSYTADRWAAWAEAAGVHTVNRASYSSSFPNALRAQRVPGSTSTAMMKLVQPFTTDDSVPLVGRTVTFAFRARAGAGFSGGTLGWRVRGGTGNDEWLATWMGGTASGFTTLESQDVVVTAADTAFSRAFAIPVGIRQLAIEFRWRPAGTAGAADYVDITAVRLQPGLEAFAQTRESVTRELRACSRFYTKTFDYDVVPAYNNGSLGGALASSAPNSANRDCHVRWPFSVEMRALPAVKLFNPIDTNNDWGAPDTGNSYESEVTSRGTRAVSVANTTGIPHSTRVVIHASANAEV